MKSTSVDTITGNDTYVRMRIFDGDLQVSEAADELIRLERSQHDDTKRRLAEALEALAA